MGGMESRPELIAYAGLMTMAVIPIVIGSHLSLANDKTAAKEDRLSSADAYWFPVMGSLTLFTFYLVFKLCPKEWVNYLLTAYFSAFGAWSLSQLMVKSAQQIVTKNVEMAGSFHIRINQKANTLVDFNVTWLNSFSLLLSFLFSAYYALTKNWIASNVFGISFSVTAISMIHLDSFKTGIALLAGLFFYDIFWVFGTDVMVTVAKNFDVPVKLLFPRDVVSDAWKNFSMLGLGDIVLPGVFIALCLKFDRSLGKCNCYFTTAMISYAMYVMHTFKAAQPALLYLSPACIISSCLTALVRGQLKPFFAFDTSKDTDKITKTAKPVKSD